PGQWEAAKAVWPLFSAWARGFARSPFCFPVPRNEGNGAPKRRVTWDYSQILPDAPGWTRGLRVRRTVPVRLAVRPALSPPARGTGRKFSGLIGNGDGPTSASWPPVHAGSRRRLRWRERGAT